MIRRALIILLWMFSARTALALPSYDEIDQPPHNYWQRPLNDRFTRLKDDLESGRIALDRGGEKAFLMSLLRTLGVPATSQMLVFSTTSLQLGLISPRNPRALYFNEDLYVGYIPGGRIEIVSLDPELGGIFYIFDIPKDERPLRIERSQRCMNCHARADTRHVPGLVVKSVIPGPGGGSLTAYRQEETGHGIPFEKRFGGWYVTGKHGITNHWGNLVGELSPQGLAKNPVEPGKSFAFDRYPVTTSDVLPQLLHEHQAGFVNRVLEASYRARTYLHAGQGALTSEHEEELDKQARLLVRYLLFADEIVLPSDGVEGDAAFKSDFLRDRRITTQGVSLKDFDLRTRLFKHRCSYMIYSPVFEGLPPAMKERVYRRLGEALNVEKPDQEYAYLPAVEKGIIRGTLKETLRDLPARW
jgi:hypothetical protein